MDPPHTSAFCPYVAQLLDVKQQQSPSLCRKAAPSSSSSSSSRKPPKKRAVTMLDTTENQPPQPNIPPPSSKFVVSHQPLPKPRNYMIHPPLKNKMLDQLIEDHGNDFFCAADKRTFVQQEILAKLGDGPMEVVVDVCDNEDSKKKNTATNMVTTYDANAEEAFAIVTHKIWANFAASCKKDKDKNIYCPPPQLIGETARVALVTPQQSKPVVLLSGAGSPVLPGAVAVGVTSTTSQGKDDGNKTKEELIESLQLEVERLRSAMPKEQQISSNDESPNTVTAADINNSSNNRNETAELDRLRQENQQREQLLEQLQQAHRRSTDELRGQLRARDCELERVRANHATETNRLRRLVRAKQAELQAERSNSSSSNEHALVDISALQGLFATTASPAHSSAADEEAHVTESDI